jgi:hypothetical protein
MLLLIGDRSIYESKEERRGSERNGLSAPATSFSLFESRRKHGDCASAWVFRLDRIRNKKSLIKYLPKRIQAGTSTLLYSYLVLVIM